MYRWCLVGALIGCILGSVFLPFDRTASFSIPDDFAYQVKKIIDESGHTHVDNFLCEIFEDIGMKELKSYKEREKSFGYNIVRYLANVVVKQPSHVSKLVVVSTDYETRDPKLSEVVMKMHLYVMYCLTLQVKSPVT